MRPDSDGRNAIIRDNLALLDIEAGSVSERRLMQLYDRAALILQDDELLTSEDRCEAFDAMFDRPNRIAPSSAEAAHPYLHDTAANDLLADKLTVCRFAAERLKQKRGFRLDQLLSADEDAVELAPSPKIAYLKNAYADTAFRIFSGVLNTPSVVYAGDFAQVCEEVYYGRADMCILPVDSSRDAKLISFYRLIDKYELKIALSCDVTSPDGSVTTRYALLRKSLELPRQSWLDAADASFLEFSLIPDEKVSLADVLRAAEVCGLYIYKIDALPLSYSDSEFSYDIILRVGEGGFESFALFLALAVPQYEPLGIYPHIR
ncbi:MAG: hypothetical protein IJ493_07550 [Clostridia bacterium]|nr:hypothetical protein [Clostridia bacterium]